MEKIENLLKRKIFVFCLLFFILFVQLVYSFVFPSSGASSGTGHGWLSFEDLLHHKKSPLNNSDNSIIAKSSPLFSKYTIIADGAVYILLAKNFPQYYFENNIFLSRPLYSFLIAAVAFLPNLFFNSYAVFFAAAIFLNFILAFAAALLFYLLVEKIISSRVAFLSSFLYIFSPHVHIGLVQPDPRVYGTFMIVAGLYLIFNYIKKPSLLKLAIFSFILGILLLGKLFVTLSVFVLILAVYFKRYKEGILFLIINLLPLFFWYLFVTLVLKLKFYDVAVGVGAVVWMSKIFSWPWQKTAQIFLDFIPNYISATIYGFLVAPLFFAFIGFKNLVLEKKEIIYFSFILSFLALFFATNFIFPYHAFLIFPLVYPLTVLGIDRIANFLKQYGRAYGAIFYAAAMAILIIISSVNIYQILPNPSF